MIIYLYYLISKFFGLNKYAKGNILDTKCLLNANKPLCVGISQFEISHLLWCLGCTGPPVVETAGNYVSRMLHSIMSVRL